MILTGANDYSGGTTVSGGTLDFAGPTALSTTGILTIQSGGRVVLDDLVGAAAPSTAECMPAAEDVAADNANTTSGRISGVSGIGSISALLERIRAAQSADGTTAGSAGGGAVAASPAAVPEPSAFALLGIAAVGLLGYARRRKRTWRLA